MSEAPALLLRSLLFAPGNEPRKIDKVATFGADGIILDLEDAVPDAAKLAARGLVKAASSHRASTASSCRRPRAPSTSGRWTRSSTGPRRTSGSRGGT